ncbi:helix-turn-helix transcriptional regulator [Anaerostipes hominis (ex Lee et al. 2021)]|uniref:Helix-turn-helix transcriptional regulator n=2 Tax=Lachnospiraceae TaxID=186803 RepID=A0ABV4DFN9_9FIRM|nr:helix-turn-helix transcriptional regulator [Anaerostipes hominis (ex Lee et al. 2021)]
MIKFDRLWTTMSKQGISVYDLYTHYNVSRSQINRLKHNQNVHTNTLDRLCNILQCDLNDIAEHIHDDNRF